ncbi:MAG TPA: FecR domain-containing protein [Polyangiaceae bacterium]|jgi:hypothetical protein|nr:FecR domain-containing protein [Polyangiaceae bacterium]
MTRALCPRLFEVEAASDGRLTGLELANFQRHMTACPACRREAQALAALDEALRAIPTNQLDELQTRREKTRLLAAFDRDLVKPRRHWRARWLLWPTPIAALVASLFVFWHLRASQPLPAQPARAASVVVHADSTALWSEQTEGPLDQIRLERGSLWLHVDHSSQKARRVVVLLPDGELEDTGTTFTVSAEGGRTTRVAVQDGSVVLRLRGQSAVALGPGETWSPNLPPPASACASCAPPPEALPSAKLSPPAPTAPRPSSAEPVASVLVPDPAIDFRAALAALDAGDNTGAAAAFETFLVKHPRDPRAEDAAYLRIIAFRRSGADGSMKQAAREYLRRYPAGFRRAEVQALAP